MKSSNHRGEILNGNKPQRALLGATLAAAITLVGGHLQAQDAAKPEAKAEKGPPLPLHQIEGNGGIFSTLSAYLVNPPRNNEPIGRPSVGFAHVQIGHGTALEAFTLTESPHERVELGFGYDYLGLGDLPQAVQNATGLSIDKSVSLYNANARFQLLKENDFDTKWLPAVTFGAHYKNNQGINTINNQLLGTLKGLGIRGNDGVDFTLYASKLITALPRPVLLNVGGRATEGAHLGLLGFTSGYNFVAEGSVVVFITDSLALAAEYKQKPNAYKSLSPLIGKESDWITLDVAYVVNKHFTIAAGYGRFGDVLNHQANGVWGITTKFEF
ncbi:MAG: DUF3034 family protein [Verrucomicrobiota bacterium]